MVFGESNSLFTDWERCYQNIITFLMKEENEKEKTVKELPGTVSEGNLSENGQDASIVWRLFGAYDGCHYWTKTQPNIELKILRDYSCLLEDPCYFHWGKLLNHSFSCCKQSPGSVGCTTGKLHVWNGTVDGTNEPLDGFVKTKSSGLGNKQNVYALDCEMCYTGLELSRVVIRSCTGSIVYDHFVKPDNEVVDYNTRYSGVTESDIHDSTAKSFSNVQSDILKLFTEDTILVGHSLDNDLRVLKILHSKIVDNFLSSIP
ncbi:putative exonuclease GOR [Harmonia axyridis]|uniref:putative exonuclease GOR n=1 Tax=Harmonia axyridis TaxID=115357 RepID=UPI001E2795F4|nr:putative exonuclease GOR [Harmonia axyridis]